MDKKKVKIKQSTLRNDYKDGGLKSVDIEHKIASLKCSWVIRLYTENFHEWKIIRLHSINNYIFLASAKINRNVGINIIQINFPSFNHHLPISLV